MNDSLPWLILFLPLLSAVLITLFTQKSPRVSAVFSVGAIFVSLLLSIGLFASRIAHAPAEDISVNWLKVGRLSIDFGIHIDSMSLLMLLIVTGVGSAIHLYSVAYMKGDRAVGRFFAGLSLFTFAMLGVVLSNNFMQMFIFWELVGACSYLLIGFWYERASAADAAKKAFLTNRLGDFGFLTGIILFWSVMGTLNFKDGQSLMQANPAIFGAAATTVGLLIFCGAVGKSAQFPLHVWLPDAMEGPTPVSALIHAATMVAAGVYMLCRVFFVFDVPVLEVIAWIGGVTALMSALIACQQDDIKRILAYSTLSQLGYMVMAVGLHEPPAAMFHLATHAFFKALLFLGAGSVIHALSQEQSIWKMGRLKEKMPVTYWTFLAGTLALCGCPLTSGFFSKDDILGAAYHGNMSLFVVGIVVAFLTTFYMFRLFVVVFLGRAKSDLPAHAHESPKMMTVPLIVLAVFAVLLGVVGTPAWPWFEAYLRGESLHFDFGQLTESGTLGLMASSAVIVFTGLGLGWFLYGRRQRQTAEEKDILERAQPALFSLLQNKYYVDEFYEHTVIRLNAFAAAFCNFLDNWIFGGAVLLVTYAALGCAWLYRLTDEYLVNVGFDAGCESLRGSGGLSSKLHTGRVQTYLRVIGVALVVLVLILIWGRKA